MYGNPFTATAINRCNLETKKKNKFPDINDSLNWLLSFINVFY